MRPQKTRFQCWGTPGAPDCTLIPDPPDQTVKPRRGEKFLYALEAPDENCAMVLHFRKQEFGRYRLPPEEWPTEWKVPKIGDVIYVPCQWYLSRGMDDFMGGKALVTDVYCDYVNGGLEAVIHIRERPNHGYYWRATLGRDGNQEKWAEEYGDQWSYPDPDDDPDSNRWD